MVSSNKRLLQRFRVPLGFIFAAVFLYFARPVLSVLIVGGIVAFAGLFIRAWASGHIHKYERLAISGPYAFTRNPLYLGSFILAIGLTIATGVWWLSLITATLFLGIYLPVMRVEEQDLRSRFGEEFEAFATNVPLFVPRLLPWKKLDASFDFQLYLMHREYQATIGYVVILTVLSAKMLLYS
jgi:protein-S-isoprenylcysteine O-methyltransferase Ste14